MRHIWITIIALLGSAFFAHTAQAQTDTLKNQISVGINFLTHGEVQGGGLPKPVDPDVNVADVAAYIMGRLRLNVGYQRPGIEAKAVIQNLAVWGMSGNMSLGLYEGWVKLSNRIGLFAQLGRVALSYDDERIIGLNDFAMASLSHDILRAGYEGHGHKAHAIVAFNQNGSNVYTNTYYVNGAQPYKTMQTLWYHYDIPKFPLGASLLFMNIGQQAGDPNQKYNQPKVVWQQLAGAYLKYAPEFLTLEASYYRQWGMFVDANQNTGKLDAWMASAKAEIRPWKFLGFTLGYDYLSGDDYVPVIYGGSLGLPRHDVCKGFTPMMGSRTKFYGLLDYFYQSAHINGFTPGLQNAYAGIDVSPFKGFKAGVTYHFLAAGTKLRDLDSTLGHDIDLSVSYKFNKWITLEIGYTQMMGTETMNRLKQGGGSPHANWGWFSLVVNPEIFKGRW